jgi:hypothetical protein
MHIVCGRRIYRGFKMSIEILAGFERENKMWCGRCYFDRHFRKGKSITYNKDEQNQFVCEGCGKTIRY